MKRNSNEGFRIEWDLRELGDKAPSYPATPVPAARLSPREFAMAIAMGEIPANAARLAEDEAA